MHVIHILCVCELAAKVISVTCKNVRFPLSYICDRLQEKGPFVANFMFTYWRIVHGTLYNAIQAASRSLTPLRRSQVTGSSVGLTGNQI